MDTQTAFLTMLILLIIGEVISIATKAFVPSMFISAVLFVIGFWTYFPQDILQLGGVASNLPTFLVMMMVVHLGTMLNIKELLDQWKTVIVTLAGMLGILVVILVVGSFLIGSETAAIAAPPLTGGFVAAMMMQSIAPTEELAILAMTVYVLQGFVGYPLTSLCLKKEGKFILKAYREGKLTSIKTDAKVEQIDEKHTALFPQIPEKFKSDFTHLFLMVVLAVMAGYLDNLSMGYVSKFVWALLLGVFGSAFGFIDRNVLVRSRSMGFVYTLIMMFVFSQLKSVTPETLVQLLKSFSVLIVLATLGVAVFSIPVGKILGLSVPMSFAIGLGTLAGGFPASYTLSVEAAKVLSSNEEEYKLLEEHMLPKTLVAGFVSATSGSVLIAGIVMAIFFK
ncbi:hypothetical protein CG710_007180 [Lachnotalea glycerini]|uniref:Na+/glutamate symporter n=2 Tax=Lachnotalea glycerini TaxID=1763509 RepID=A0A371JGU5_9FIRM|nr:hypothetical protein CG710_007180 [Lachnotalea glycerini]